MAVTQTRTRDFDAGILVAKIVARVDGWLHGLHWLLRNGSLLPVVVGGARVPSQANPQQATVGLKRIAWIAIGGLEPMCSSYTRSRRRLRPVTLR